MLFYVIIISNSGKRKNFILMFENILTIQRNRILLCKMLFLCYNNLKQRKEEEFYLDV